MNTTPPINPVKSLSFIDFLWQYKVKLLVGIFGIFFVTYTGFALLGMLPESLQAEPGDVVGSVTVIPTSTASVQTASQQLLFSTSTKVVLPPITGGSKTAVVAKGENPVRIIIPAIKVNAEVLNPRTTAVATLDSDLRVGAVRYPGSAGLGAGNTFIFGHSTSLKVVVNHAYQTFNNFRFLKKGDVVTVYSLDKVYTYEVEIVKLADASDVFVDLSTKTNMLTLSTCNTLGEKEERYVVEALFKKVEPIRVETI